MALESFRTCDFPVGKAGRKCGERVPDDEPLPFTVEGVDYEADICEKHRQVFLDAVKPFIGIARALSTRKSRKVRTALKGRNGAFTTKDVRTWLQEQGRDVAPSGRLPNEFIEEYVQAHQ